MGLGILEVPWELPPSMEAELEGGDTSSSMERVLVEARLQDPRFRGTPVRGHVNQNLNYKAKNLNV